MKVGDRVRVLNRKAMGEPASGRIVKSGEWRDWDGFLLSPLAYKVRMDWPWMEGESSLWFHDFEIRKESWAWWLWDRLMLLLVVVKRGLGFNRI